MKKVIIASMVFLFGCGSLPVNKARQKAMRERREERIREIREIRQDHSEWVIRQIKLRLLEERLDKKYGK